MIFYVIVADAAFAKLPKIASPSENISLIVDDAIYIPSWVEEQYNIIPIKATSEVDDKKSCVVFAKLFHKNRVYERFSSDFEPHINAVYEYVLSSINNILYTIDFVATPDDQVNLIGGNHKLKIGACYAVKSPEFNKNVFYDRADVLNPFLYEALSDGKVNVIYHENSLFFTRLKYIFRVFLLFCYSFVFTLIKYVLGCIKISDRQESLNDKGAESFIVFPVRSDPQLDFADSLASSLDKAGSKVRPLVFYYEMLMGRAFHNRLTHKSYSYISLFKFKYIGLLLLLPILLIKNAFKNYAYLSKVPVLNLSSGRFNYKFPLTYLTFENLAAPHAFFYEAILNKTIIFLKLSKKVKVHGLCSTEMIGTQAFIERSVANNNFLKFNNIQTAVVYDRYYPVKVIGDYTFCLSEEYAESFNTRGINNKGNAQFIGTLKYLSSNAEPERVSGLSIILYATQPYEPELTLVFLRELSYYINHNHQGIRLRIRLHPRDDIKNYSSLKNVEFVSNNETISESIKSASLVLTRTSSVILDAVGYKTPFVVCKLSDFDKKVDLPFLQCSELTVINASELMLKLTNFAVLKEYYQEFIKKQESDSNTNYERNKTLLKFLSAFEHISASIEQL